MTQTSEERFGCPKCWPDDPSDAAQASRALAVEKSLIVESHLEAAIKQCPHCGQRFAYAFVEHVDWVNGNDSQYRTVMPVTEAEAAGLSGQSSISVIEILNRLPRERRSLQDDEGASWSNGMWILP